MSIKLQVEPCVLGEIQSEDGYSCIACLASTYTLGPVSNTTEGGITGVSHARMLVCEQL